MCASSSPSPHSPQHHQHHPESAPLTEKDSDVLRYCSPPFPAGFTPLRVGHEGGAPLFSILVSSASSIVGSILSSVFKGGDAQGCFGKCRLSADLAHVEAYYCSRDGKEKSITGGYKILCMRQRSNYYSSAGNGHGNGDADGDESGEEHSPIMWVPAPLLADPTYNTNTNCDAMEFVFAAHGRFGVARAILGSGLHPGVREPSGRCVCPYGGRAVPVSGSSSSSSDGTAEVLCVRARVPAEMARRVATLSRGEAMRRAMEDGEGTPFSSFDALLRWSGGGPGKDATATAPVAPLRHRKGRAGEGTGPRSPTQQQQRADGPSLFIDSLAPSVGADGSPTATNAAASPSSRLSPSSSLPSRQPRLMVCHDYAGGYLPSDRSSFFIHTHNTNSCGIGSARREPTVLDIAYTVSYWGLVDVFVYFSHHRVTVPPRAWVEAAHRHGVPALGTIITEGDGGLRDLRLVLSDAVTMGRVIARLADLCVAFSFDGYLVNIENSLDAGLARRLVLFTDTLRKRVQSAVSGGHGQVVWYDAVTIDGPLQYQNALTAKNKPFFDVADGIFTNYFWNPMHLAMTKTTAATAGRRADVYVGVDVFGRNMHGGGKFNTHVATREAVGCGLSVALFAPGWTLESLKEEEEGEARGGGGGGRRDAFLRAECKLWSRLQSDFHQRPLACRLVSNTHPHHHHDQSSGCGATAAAVWTSFASGVGTQFFINGSPVVSASSTLSSSSTTGKSATGAGYCQFAMAHVLPPFLYEAPQDTVSSSSPLLLSSPTSSSSSLYSWPVRLPLVADGGRVHGGTAAARWRTDRAWLGDQSLAMTVPPAGAVRLADWCVTGLEQLSASATAFTNSNNEEYHDDHDIDAHVDGGATAASVVVDAAFMTEPSAAAATVEALKASLGLRVGVVVAVATAAAASHHLDPNSSGGGGVADGREGGGKTYKTKQMLITGAESHVIYSADAWHILRFNITAAAAAHTGGGSPTHTSGSALHHHSNTNRNNSSNSVELAEVNSISLMNLSGGRSLVCTVGAIAVHAVTATPTPTATGGSGSGDNNSHSSPLIAVRAAGPWPAVSLHPTRVARERVLELHDAGATVASIAAPGSSSSSAVAVEVPVGQERSVAVVATVLLHGGGNSNDKHDEASDSNSKSAVRQQRVFLGVHRVSPDAGSLLLRLSTNNTTKTATTGGGQQQQPSTSLQVSHVDYYLVHSGY